MFFLTVKFMCRPKRPPFHHPLNAGSEVTTALQLTPGGSFGEGPLPHTAADQSECSLLASGSAFPGPHDIHNMLMTFTLIDHGHCSLTPVCVCVGSLLLIATQTSARRQAAA